MIVRKTAYLLLLASALPSLAGAEYRLYLAQLDRAQWTVDSVEQSCLLRHEIPLFGTAVIRQEPGARPVIDVTAHQPPSAEGIAELGSRYPAHWQQTAPKVLQSVRFNADARVFSFSQHAAQRIIGELEHGRLVTLRFNAWWHDGHAEVALSNTGFRAALQQHQECLSELSAREDAPAPATPANPLLEMGYQELAFSGDDAAAPAEERRQLLEQELQILFDVATADLGPEARATLRTLAEVLRGDPSWSTLTATAYSGAQGPDRFNQELARQRAEAVRTYLAQLGVPSNRVQLRAYSSALVPDAQLLAGGEDERSRRVLVAVN